MTWRARVYLAGLAVRGLGVGGLCFVYEYVHVNPTPSLTALRVVLPLSTWAALYIGAGLIALTALVRMREAVARVALVASSALSASWFGVFIASTFREGIRAAPLVALLALFSFVFAWKDFVASAMPLRTPLEDLIAGGDLL